MPSAQRWVYRMLVNWFEWFRIQYFTCGFFFSNFQKKTKTLQNIFSKLLIDEVLETRGEPRVTVFLLSFFSVELIALRFIHQQSAFSVVWIVWNNSLDFAPNFFWIPFFWFTGKNTLSTRLLWESLGRLWILQALKYVAFYINFVAVWSVSITLRNPRDKNPLSSNVKSVNISDFPVNIRNVFNKQD